MNKQRINEKLAKKLIDEQFPQWRNLPICAVKNSGHDNRTFKLGHHMSIRLPSAAGYAPQVMKEQKWLRKLSSQLSLTIPVPIAMGKPTEDYPWNWSVYQWIEGESLNCVSKDAMDRNEIAIQLARFIKELHQIKTTNAPLAGAHNYYRGACLSVYADEAIQAITNLSGVIAIQPSLNIWHEAVKTTWENKPVWVHGDVAAGNILLKNKRIVAIIDFGCMGVGDPACDLVAAWTLFHGSSRKLFIETMQLDQATWLRAQAWAIWKAAITLQSIKNKDSEKAKYQLEIMNQVNEKLPC